MLKRSKRFFFSEEKKQKTFGNAVADSGIKSLLVLFFRKGLLSAFLLILPAQAADFAEDENACRAAGTAAIGHATGPEAAQRYDSTYGRCMEAHIRRRQFGAAPPDYPAGEVHRFEYPDAYFSVPYATPGYGYDGFSPGP